MMPLPETIHTWVPSVTGEGEDELCLVRNSFPRSKVLRQSSSPVWRERQSSRRSCPPGPDVAEPRLISRRNRSSIDSSPPSREGVLRKILSPQTTGDEPLQAGISRFHLMFCVALHVSGRFRAVVVVPSPWGPRQLGQWLAAWVVAAPNSRIMVQAHLRRAFMAREFSRTDESPDWLACRENQT